MPRIFFLCLLGLLGCATAKFFYVSPQSDLHKYKKIAVMPFTHGPQGESQAAYRAFVGEFLWDESHKVVGDEHAHRKLLKQLDIEYAEYGVVDFSANPYGEERRVKVAQIYGADALVFGSVFVNGQEVFLYPNGGCKQRGDGREFIRIGHC
ncbi:MAG: hypothetical protein A2787_07470 [Omnitrophica WOR_2 bacterium RIFCSPHIGHO2_01_FULL_48_9]|uniref:Lipoprotein n=1 Tax=Candidatus Sungbacteria bacterium RIFCSPHIGHO2_02_FULL_47_11 TaxID=1802270 RepID=A0A1G2KKR5_9BACT|nr:MAG: hypothetical protein A2787_07470 [Omnitrophica WOR_2 bacterium RIFCSPHIGHO2_01_FULL_48_9]OGZ99995.1 MAG: hypothetical protein A3C07_04125 [Candidatus Sungbacteria bacterium RIFCSPHIGHO2_02_FULL_47_11]